MTDQLQALTLLDLSDREVLLVIRDVCTASSDGWAYGEDVAAHLDIGGDNAHRAATSRMSWLKRYGALERSDERMHATESHPNGQRGWRLSPLGLAIATGKLSKAQQAAFEKMDAGSLVMATRWLSRHISSANGTTGKLLDREYRYGTKKR